MRVCRACGRTIPRDEGCWEVLPHQAEGELAPGFYCLSYVQFPAAAGITRYSVP